MKTTSKKLLFFLTRPLQRELLLLPGSHLRGLVPELSDAGFRSLVALLKRQHLLISETVGSKKLVRISDAGIHALSRELPVLEFTLSPWQGKWSCLVFTVAPASDLQFRFLRETLIKKRAIPISRGVYLYPGEFPDSILTECRDRYRTSATIFSIADWVLGDDRQLIIEKYSLLDVAQTYSGISNEIDRLISKEKRYEAMSDQQKKHFHSLFDRIYATAEEDTGLLTYYFPQVSTAWSLLSRLQTAIQ